MRNTARVTIRIAAAGGALLAITGLTVAAEAVPTRVVVRAVSRDAKIIGSGVGGARITIREERSGKVLAQGIQQGGSGDTHLIMRNPRQRHAAVYDTPGAAHFEATIALSEPTLIKFEAVGPLSTPEALYRASKTLLMIPGQHVLGEGVLLEIHGFIVEVQEFPMPVARTVEKHRVKAKVTMA